MTREIPESHPLHRLFRGLTETTFVSELGIADPQLVGYVAELLVRFVPTTGMWSIRDRKGQRVANLVGMIAEAELAADEAHRRECYRHVGDFTLFWTGVYPEALSRLQSPTSVDHLVDFQTQGKRSYYLASIMEGEDAPVMRQLSVDFELCAFGLSRIRREWERPDDLGSKRPVLVA